MIFGYFYDYLTATAKGVAGVQPTAMSQLFQAERRRPERKEANLAAASSPGLAPQGVLAILLPCRRVAVARHAVPAHHGVSGRWCRRKCRASIGAVCRWRARSIRSIIRSASIVLLTQYGSWIWNFVRATWGRPTYPPAGGAFRHRCAGQFDEAGGGRLRLVVPIGILGGGCGAQSQPPLDRIISLGGLSVTVLPEFVTGIILILIFGVWLRWFPPHGRATGLALLSDPAVPPLFLVLFGYIARMARWADRGARFRLHQDRCAQGLPWRTMIWRHVLRNALLPTIVATQTGISSAVSS